MTFCLPLSLSMYLDPTLTQVPQHKDVACTSALMGFFPNNMGPRTPILISLLHLTLHPTLHPFLCDSVVRFSIGRFGCLPESGRSALFFV